MLPLARNLCRKGQDKDMADTPKITIQEMPDGERPRERLLMHGAEALSNTELLAIILRTGTKDENALHLAERILVHCGGLLGLAQSSSIMLQGISGLGQAKTAQILAAITLGKRALTYKPEEKPLIKNASDAARLVMDMTHLQQEQIRVILLDSAQKVIAIPTIYIGTVNATMLRISEILREAVTRNAPALIIVHNHPSGDPTPSPEDIRLTRKLIDACKLLDIILLDHLIIAGSAWCSLKEENLGF